MIKKILQHLQINKVQIYSTAFSYEKVDVNSVCHPVSFLHECGASLM